jgi:hypothetical protein
MWERGIFLLFTTSNAAFWIMRSEPEVEHVEELSYSAYTYSRRRKGKKLFGFLGKQGIYSLLDAQLRLHVRHVTSYRSLSAIVAQPENFPIGVNTTI